MAEGQHHHHQHLFHHRKKVEGGSTEGGTVTYEEVGVAVVPEEALEKARKEEKHAKREQHMGELGAVAAGAFALYEKHEANKDPEHAHKHKIEEEIAASTMVGAGGFAFHEHHQKKEAKNEEEVAEGKHKH